MLKQVHPKFLRDTVTIFNPFQVADSTTAGWNDYKDYYTATVITNCNFTDANVYNFRQDGTTSGDNFRLYIDAVNSVFTKTTESATYKPTFVEAQSWPMIALSAQASNKFTLTKGMFICKGYNSAFNKAKISRADLNISALAKLGLKLYTAKLCDVAEDFGKIHSYRIEG